MVLYSMYSIQFWVVLSKNTQKMSTVYYILYKILLKLIAICTSNVRQTIQYRWYLSRFIFIHVCIMTISCIKIHMNLYIFFVYVRINTHKTYICDGFSSSIVGFSYNLFYFFISFIAFSVKCLDIPKNSQKKVI